MEDAVVSTSKPALWEPNPWLRYLLVFLSIIQILFMVFYWAIYVMFLIAGIVFAPGRELEFTTFGALLTAFIVVSIGTTCHEIVLFFSNSKPAMTPWLLVHIVLSGLWMALPIIYLVWLMRNPYIVPFAFEVFGMAATCLVFFLTLLWNALKLYEVYFPGKKTTGEVEDIAPLLDEDNANVDEGNGSL